MSAITYHFKQIKHLHPHVRHASSCPEIRLGTGCRFSQWFALYGSELEQFRFLTATSVYPYPNPTTPSASQPSASDWGPDAYNTTVRNTTLFYSYIRGVVSRCQNIESVVLTDKYTAGGRGGGVVFMGKPQIAKLKAFLIQQQQQGNLEARYRSHVGLYNEPALDLPRSGYTLKDVAFAKLTLVGDDDQVQDDDAGIVSAFDSVAAALNLNGLDFDMDKWQVLLEAAQLIEEDENKKPTLTWDLDLNMKQASKEQQY